MYFDHESLFPLKITEERPFGLEQWGWGALNICLSEENFFSCLASNSIGNKTQRSSDSCALWSESLRIVRISALKNLLYIDWGVTSVSNKFPSFSWSYFLNYQTHVCNVHVVLFPISVFTFFPIYRARKVHLYSWNRRGLPADLFTLYTAWPWSARGDSVLFHLVSCPWASPATSERVGKSILEQRVMAHVCTCLWEHSCDFLKYHAVESFWWRLGFPWVSLAD